MKKIIIIMAVALMSLPAISENSYLVFHTSDGVIHAITSSGLDINFIDDELTATNATESLTLSLSELSYMEFATEVTGISEITSENIGNVDITGINGISYGSFSSIKEAYSKLATGVYIVKHENGETSKLIIRK